MQRSGENLAHTLHRLPVTILLSGELGAGKTTFIQGFARGLGITDVPSSPTYALEQRYSTERFGEFLHMDLYRLNPEQARELVEQTHDHEGIRCIEWPEKLEVDLPQAFPHSIHLHIQEEGTGRRIEAVFDELPLPSDEQIRAWRKDVMLPEHIVKHCDAVAGMCVELAGELIKQGVFVRMDTVRKAGLLHDLFRFIDFRPGASPSDFTITDEQNNTWNHWKERFAGQKHETAIASFLRSEGFPELARIIEPHGLVVPSPDRFFTEQKLLYYADKRIIQNKKATLEERFADFRERYAGGKVTPEAEWWFEEIKMVERELFGDSRLET